MSGRTVGVASMLVVSLLLAGVAGVSPATATAPDGEAQTSQRIVVTQELRLTPDRPGYVEVHWQFDVPDAVSEVRTLVPSEAEDIQTTGFSSTGNDKYVWDGGTDTPSLTFTVRANETGAKTGPEGSEGKYLFVDAGEWAITKTYYVPVGFRYSSDVNVTVSRRNTTAGPGVAGDSMAYLGPHESVTRSAHGQQFTLVVPDAATLAESRDAIFGSVTAASDSLRVGDRDSTVLMIAAPTSVAWGVEGLERGDSNFYVTADERVDTPGNTWLHEYVHTRQQFNLTRETEWFTEGSAQYYAALATLRQDRIDFQRFADHLERGTYSRYDDVVLASPSTWESNGGNYVKGALVVGELDRRTRLAGASTFQAVVRRLNDSPDSVGQSGFLRFVERAGNASIAQAASRYTETTATPDVWSASEHQNAFGTLPALMRHHLPSQDSAFAVRGPYRNTTLAGVLQLVAGERLRTNVTVTNVGGETGRYNLTVLLNRQVVDRATGTLAPDETATVPVTVAFPDPGNYTLAVEGDDGVTSTDDGRRRVEVLEPAPLSVTDLRANRTTVRPGDAVRVTATVVNDAGRPGRRQVTVAVDGEAVLDRRVRLDIGGRQTVTTTVTIPTAGSHRVTAGGASVTVTAQTPTSGGTPTDTDGSEPGTDGATGVGTTSSAPPSTGDTGGSANDPATAGGSGPGLGPGVLLLALGALLAGVGLARQ